MKKETFIQIIDYGEQGDTVVINYSQLVGENSRGNFKITMDRMKFAMMNKENKLIDYLDRKR